MEIDLAVFLAAAIENAGGEIRLPYDTFTETLEKAKAIAIDLEDDGQSIVLTLTEEIPEDV